MARWRCRTESRQQDLEPIWSNTDTIISILTLHNAIRSKKIITECTNFSSSHTGAFLWFNGSYLSISSHFSHKIEGHVNDPTVPTGLPSLKRVSVNISHQESRMCNSEHNDYSFCDFVHLCVLELFTVSDWSDRLSSTSLSFWQEPTVFHNKLLYIIHKTNELLLSVTLCKKCNGFIF